MLQLCMPYVYKFIKERVKKRKNWLSFCNCVKEVVLLVNAMIVAMYPMTLAAMATYQHQHLIFIAHIVWGYLKTIMKQETGSL